MQVCWPEVWSTHAGLCHVYLEINTITKEFSLLLHHVMFKLVRYLGVWYRYRLNNCFELFRFRNIILQDVPFGVRVGCKVLWKCLRPMTKSSCRRERVKIAHKNRNHQDIQNIYLPLHDISNEVSEPSFRQE